MGDTIRYAQTLEQPPNEGLRTSRGFNLRHSRREYLYVNDERGQNEARSANRVWTP
jgi:hypothetical protein